MLFLILSTGGLPRESIAVYGHSPNQDPILVFAGVKSPSTPIDDVGNYVPAWQAVAAISDGWLLACSPKGVRKVVRHTLADVNAKFAVSPDGKTLAEYEYEAARLVFYDVAQGKRLRSVSSADLRRLHIPVREAHVSIAGVFFAPDGRTVLAAFPTAGPLNDASERPGTVLSIPAKQGRVIRIAVKGVPVGFADGTPAILNYTTNQLRIGATTRRFPDGTLFGSNGKKVYALSPDRRTLTRYGLAKGVEIRRQVSAVPIEYVYGFVPMPDGGQEASLVPRR